MSISARAASPTERATFRTLFLSDEAYNHLAQQASLSGFVTLTKYTTRGMEAYIAYLMRCHMSDARPPDVRVQDADMLSVGMAPDWRIHWPRAPHKIRVTQDTLILGAAHCLTLGIAYAPARRILNAPTFHDLVPCMSALLEAIGSELVDVKVNIHE